MCSDIENMDTDVRGERVKLTKLYGALSDGVV